MNAYQYVAEGAVARAVRCGRIDAAVNADDPLPGLSSEWRIATHRTGRYHGPSEVPIPPPAASNEPPAG